MNKILKIVPYIVIALLVGVTVSYAGSLTPPGAPAQSMYKLSDLYELINTGANTPDTTFTTPGTISATMNSIEDIYDLMTTKISAIDGTQILTGTTIFGVGGSASAGGLPKTGQVLCYGITDNSSQNPCLDGTNTDGGQDGYYQKGLPTSGSRFVDNADDTVSDNATGLMWKKCSEGQSGASCTGVGSTLSWRDALAICEADTTAGFTNWRLPNSLELISLVYYGNVIGSGTPVIDTSVFPNTVAGSSYYWSSTTYNESFNEALNIAVSFYNGLNTTRGKTLPGVTRCVR